MTLDKTGEHIGQFVILEFPFLWRHDINVLMFGEQYVQLAAGNELLCALTNIAIVCFIVTGHHQRGELERLQLSRGGANYRLCGVIQKTLSPIFE